MRIVILGVLLGVALIASAIGGLALYLESSSNDKAESSILDSQLGSTATPTSPSTARQARTPTPTVPMVTGIEKPHSHHEIPQQITTALEEMIFETRFTNDLGKFAAVKRFRERADVKALEKSDRLFQLEMKVMELEFQLKFELDLTNSQIERAHR